MNNQSPLVPQGSMLEQNTKNKGRARVKIAVFFVLAIHGVGLLALLMQGCKGEKENASNQNEQTNAAPIVEQQFQPTNPVVTADTNVLVTPTVTMANPPATPATPAVTDGVASDYVVAHGDTFSTIAKAKKVTVKALTEANPGVEPTKLQIGQKLHIPAPTVATVAQPASNGAPATDANTG